MHADRLCFGGDRPEYVGTGCLKLRLGIIARETAVPVEAVTSERDGEVLLQIGDFLQVALIVDVHSQVLEVNVMKIQVKPLNRGSDLILQNARFIVSDDQLGWLVSWW